MILPWVNEGAGIGENPNVEPDTDNTGPLSLKNSNMRKKQRQEHLLAKESKVSGQTGSYKKNMG